MSQGIQPPIPVVNPALVAVVDPVANHMIDHPNLNDPVELGKAIFDKLHQNREEELKKFKNLSTTKMILYISDLQYWRKYGLHTQDENDLSESYVSNLKQIKLANDQKTDYWHYYRASVIGSFISGSSFYITDQISKGQGSNLWIALLIIVGAWGIIQLIRFCKTK